MWISFFRAEFMSKGSSWLLTLTRRPCFIQESKISNLNYQSMLWPHVGPRSHDNHTLPSRLPPPQLGVSEWRHSLVVSPFLFSYWLQVGRRHWWRHIRHSSLVHAHLPILIMVRKCLAAPVPTIFPMRTYTRLWNSIIPQEVVSTACRQYEKSGETTWGCIHIPSWKKHAFVTFSQNADLLWSLRPPCWITIYEMRTGSSVPHERPV